jgi:AcrR family transcriptional regulator
MESTLYHVPRPARYDAEHLLDVALALAVEHTPAGLAVADVARRAGAPSGSVYHRFPTRAALLGELRVRSIELFQEGFLDSLTDANPADGARAAARHVLTWSRANPDHARLLLFAQREFLPDDWPDAVKARAVDHDRRLRETLRRLARDLSVHIERILIALIDLPLAVVRRHLTTGSGIRASATTEVEACVDALLVAGQARRNG